MDTFPLQTQPTKYTANPFIRVGWTHSDKTVVKDSCKKFLSCEVVLGIIRGDGLTGLTACVSILIQPESAKLGPLYCGETHQTTSQSAWNVSRLAVM